MPRPVILLQKVQTPVLGGVEDIFCNKLQQRIEDFFNYL